MPEDLPEHMPEDMPDKMPDRMPEDMSDRMPEDLLESNFKVAHCSGNTACSGTLQPAPCQRTNTKVGPALRQQCPSAKPCSGTSNQAPKRTKHGRQQQAPTPKAPMHTALWQQQPATTHHPAALAPAP